MDIVGYTAGGNALAVDVNSIRDESDGAISAVIATVYVHNETVEGKGRLLMATGRFYTHCRAPDARLPLTWYGIGVGWKVLLTHSAPQEFVMLDEQSPLADASKLICDTQHPATTNRGTTQL